MSEELQTGIEDRSDVFYWQTDRAVDPEEAGRIWADRHRYFSDSEIISRVSSSLDDAVVEIEPLDLGVQTNLGNVNSVRSGVLVSGKEVIIRCHPKGLKNGYFHAESEAAKRAKTAGLPSYETLAIHDYEGNDDFAFQVIEKLPGKAVVKWLEVRPDDETMLVTEIGRMMARVHQIQVEGYGPFDNELAKQGKLVGIHKTLRSSMRAGLTFNLDWLVSQDVITSGQKDDITKLFESDPSLDGNNSVLVHNDFADWNLLTDGIDITGILDWDECVASDPVADIACWSTFFEPARLDAFLEGYWQIAEKPENFEHKFELMRLRYVISKMTLRTRRYSWQPTDFMKDKIESGKKHLGQSIAYFNL